MTGRPMGRFTPKQPGKVFVYNVEDDSEEQRRRFSAALRQIDMTPADLAGRVFRLGPHNISTLVRGRAGRISRSARCPPNGCSWCCDEANDLVVNWLRNGLLV